MKSQRPTQEKIVNFVKQVLEEHKDEITHNFGLVTDDVILMDPYFVNDVNDPIETVGFQSHDRYYEDGAPIPDFPVTILLVEKIG